MKPQNKEMEASKEKQIQISKENSWRTDKRCSSYAAKDFKREMLYFLDYFHEELDTHSELMNQ